MHMFTQLLSKTVTVKGDARSTESTSALQNSDFKHPAPLPSKKIILNDPALLSLHFIEVEKSKFSASSN